MRFVAISLISFLLLSVVFASEGKCDNNLSNVYSQHNKERQNIKDNRPQLNDAQIFEREMLKRKQALQGQKRTKKLSGKSNSNRYSSGKSSSKTKSSGGNVERNIPSLSSGMFVK